MKSLMRFCFTESSQPFLKMQREQQRGECYSKVLDGTLLGFWHKRISCAFYLSSDLLILCKGLAVCWKSTLSGGSLFHVVFLYAQVYNFCMHKHTWEPPPCGFILAQIWHIHLSRQLKHGFPYHVVMPLIIPVLLHDLQESFFIKISVADYHSHRVVGNFSDVQLICRTSGRAKEKVIQQPKFMSTYY